MSEQFHYENGTDGCDETWDIYFGERLLFSIPFWDEQEETEALAHQICRDLNNFGSYSRI